MGAVKHETRNEGRGQKEWDYICLSEVRVIKQLILHRSQLDHTYAALHNRQSLLGATEMAEMYEPVFLTYVDLDRLIGQCGLSAEQYNVIKVLMVGYSLTDCAEMRCIPKQSIITHLNRAAEKIAAQNAQNWEEVYGK